jgi:hypothetical protein
MRWPEVLDELERGAEESERFFTAGAIGPAGDEPPSLLELAALLEATPDLGPLPDDLASRARAVLRRIDTVNAQLSRIPKPTQDTGRTHFAGASSARPTRFDQAL